MPQINPTIVVVAFNREHSLRRLLKSLKNARYPKKNVHLIISIDRGEKNLNVLEVAKRFTWVHGEKIVKYQPVNLGLKKHVMQCASFSKDYGSVILLEDDLYVSPEFYNFACQALEFSLDKEYVGGVSLYNHQFNVNAGENFSPLEDGYDNWYFQFASSWGQAWTKEQWNNFENWYLQNTELKPTPSVPHNITCWSDKSWLKYFISYLVETNKFFIYPKISLSTNFSDTGTHMAKSSTVYQVPLNFTCSKQYLFSELPKSKAIYDVFFENTQLYQALSLEKGDICIDLYGTKPINDLRKRYLLSTQYHDFKIINTFGRKLKPIDANIFLDIKGPEILLYDTRFHKKNKYKNDPYQKILYNIKHVSRRNARKLFVRMYYERFIQFLKDILRY